MVLDFLTYQDKVLGCWNGKNIGGTLGAPFECKRGVFDVHYYTQDLKEGPLPNDDLDIQLVWLNAVEKYGRFITSSILGEYWLSYVIPDWGEYGAGKSNMRLGIVPPLSGFINNQYRNSNGAFIFSEIWACLTPGHPEIAAKYAFEDATVDHSGEGVYAEIFCAVVESAAFFESDPRRLIEIGLSYIPEDSAVVKGVRCVIKSFDDGLSWQEARKVLLNTVPGSFGVLGTSKHEIAEDEPIGEMGFDAPSNIGIMIIGWLYGKGDFGESICIATNCGEDADCTAGTLGAILGITGGNSSIDEKWLKPLGGNIKTQCIDSTKHYLSIPATTEELMERVLKLTPLFLGGNICNFLSEGRGYSIKPDETGLMCHPRPVNSWYERDFRSILKQSPFVVKYPFVLFDVLLDYHEEPFIREGVPKIFRLTLENKFLYQQWLNLQWHLPDEWEISPSPDIDVSLEQYHCNIAITDAEFTIVPHNVKNARYDLVLRITSVGHHTQGLVPITLFSGVQAARL